jgi:hypothetical protein
MSQLVEFGMNAAELKEAQTLMRRAQEHLRSTHLNWGAQEESEGMVDVITHRTTLPNLNYVIPRRGTAWISGSNIEAGIKALKAKDRRPRMFFAEGLFLPIIGRTLRDLGLALEHETPIMAYKMGAPLRVPAQPTEVTVSRVSDHDGMAAWWYTYKNAYYDVFTTGVEPLVLGADLRAVFTGTQMDFILYRYGFPISVMRLSVHDRSAFICARAIFKEFAQSDLLNILYGVAIRAAGDAGCDLVFVAGERDEERQMYRDIGFVDSGSIVTYAEPSRKMETQEKSDNRLAESILIL